MSRKKMLSFAGGLIAILFVSLSLMAVMPSQRATEAFVGYASAANIVSQLPELQNVNSSMDTLRQEFTAELQKMVGELQLKTENFQQQAAMMNDVIRETKRDEIQSMERTITEFQEKANSALSERENELMAPLFNRVQQAIDKVAKARGYTHVLNLDAGQPLLLYGQPEFRLDSLVLLELDIK